MKSTLKPSQLQLIDHYAGAYCQAVDEGDEMLEILESLGDSPQADMMRARIKRHQERVKALRIEFHRVYGPKSLGAVRSRRAVIREESVNPSITKIHRVATKTDLGLGLGLDLGLDLGSDPEPEITPSSRPKSRRRAGSPFLFGKLDTRNNNSPQRFKARQRV